MFRQNTYLKLLETRKKLLLAESELNRAELLKEVDALHNEVDRVKKQAMAIGSLASSGALIATAFSLFRRHKKSENSDGPSKLSWVAAAIEGARVGTSLFKKVKSLFRDRD
jgi:hypothetical protein